jgi:glycosyltransferase involved in cell wall biosynthesis
MSLPLSVSMISFNEEANILRTIEAVREMASEIIVVDSHSTDATREIAIRAGAYVFEEDWKGHIAQKNSALDKCTQPWILALDCDEVVSPKLRAAIVAALQTPRADGYMVNRRTVYLGRTLRHMWQPDWKLRLVRRDANPAWGGYDPHDSLRIDGRTAKLHGGFLEHYSYRDLEDHFRRLLSYARISAMSYHERGKRSGVGEILVSPAAAFFKALLVKGAILDGAPGLIAAGSTYVSVFVKYCFLWELEHRRPPGGGSRGGTR